MIEAQQLDGTRRTNDREERRWQMVYVSPQEIARVFDVATRPVDGVSIPRFKDLPVGYEIVHVHLDAAAQRFIFVIYHPSWRALGETEQVPILNYRSEYVTLARATAP
jgi:acyl dehydratase